MADNSNYIGVAMGLDVTDLKAGLSEANKQIQLANSEFKAASSGMEDWTKSTEGLTAKVKQLDTVLNAQKAKLAGLQAEYEKVAEEQGENSEAARKLKVQINNQQAVVNKTQKEFDNFTNVLKQAEEGTVDLNEAVVKANGELKQLGDGAKDAGDKVEGGFGGTVAKGIAGGIAAIGAAAIAAVGSFLALAESTRETRENFNKLETAFESANHSAESAQKTYTDLYGILGDEGAATEAAQQLAKLSKTEDDLKANTRILTGVMAEYGNSIPTEGLAEGMAATAAMGTVQGTLADALEWQGVNLDEYNAKLGEMATEEERSAYIQKTLIDLYGESADAYAEKNKSIIEAREAEAELAKVTAELGAIAEPIMTTLKLLAVDLLNSITPFVELIGTGLKGALEGTEGATTQLAEGIGGILTTILEKATQMLPMILELILQLVPQIANSLLDALPQLMTVIIDLITQILNMLSVMLPQIVQKIVEILPILIEQLVAAVPQLLQAAITLLMAIVQALPTIITSLVSALPSLIDTIINAVLTAFPMLIDAAIKLFMALIEAIPVIIQALVTNLPKIINTIINGLLNALPLLLQAAIQLLMAIIDALPTIIELLVKETPKIVKTIIDTLLSRLPDLIQGAIALFMGILEAIPEICTQLLKQLPDIISTIVDGLINGIPELVKAGGDLLAGLFEGFLDPTAIWEAVKSLGGSIVDAAKSFFGIKSPSKLMRDEVGEYVGEGVGVGVAGSIPKVKKQLSKFSNFVADNLGGIKSGLSLDTSGAYGKAVGGRSIVINAGMNLQYNGNLSLKEIKQRERDHYVSIKTKLKAEGLI